MLVGLAAPAKRRPALGRTSARRRRRPRPAPRRTWPGVCPCGACGARRGMLQSCPSPAPSLARWLPRSLCLSARALPKGAGWGAGAGGRGGSCILAVGEESEPALLVSRRAQLQPRGPARPLAARPGLLEWARARPRAGGGAGHCPYPRPPPRRGAPWGRGVRSSPPGVRGVPGSGSTPGGQSRTHGRPTRAPLQPIL